MTTASGADRSDNAASVMIRSRDKRRHLSYSVVDMRDPFQVLALAVRMDEAVGEDRLQEPLERGSLYHVAEFTRTMEYLEESTAPNRKRKRPLEAGHPALAPIILSGLIAAQRAREHKLKEQQQSSVEEDMPSAEELVLYCNTLRSQALHRLRAQKRRSGIRFLSIIIGVVVVFGGTQMHAVLRVENALMQLGYVGIVPEQMDDYNDPLFESPLHPCKSYSDVGYAWACFAAEARLWPFTKDFAMPHSAALRDCHRRRCNRESRSIIQHQLSNLPGRSKEFRFGHAPYAIHTVVSEDETVLTKWTLKDPTSMKKEDELIHKELGWLGDSLVNRLVRQYVIEAVHATKAREIVRVLDVGCGIGATLYALLPPDQTSNFDASENALARLQYTGITIAGSEVMNARRLAAEHGIDNQTARFEQLSFDDSNLSEYGKHRAIVAIESLSYSRDINVTLAMLTKVLQPGGILVIVDDVVHTPEAADSEWVRDQQERIALLSNLTDRPSLLSHAEWKHALLKVGCPVSKTLDIGLQYRMSQLVSEGQPEEFSLSSVFASHRAAIARYFKGWEMWNPFFRPDILIGFLRRLQKWTGRGRDSKGERLLRTAAFFRMIQLIHEDFLAVEGARLRKQAHERVDLTYNIYVCNKRQDFTSA